VKQHNDYTVYIQFLGKPYKCDVAGMSVAIEGWGPIDEQHYASLRNYLEDEGFIQEIDKRKGIFDLFKS
jgi:hypothetical protein